MGVKDKFFDFAIAFYTSDKIEAKPVDNSDYVRLKKFHAQPVVKPTPYLEQNHVFPEIERKRSRATNLQDALGRLDRR